MLARTYSPASPTDHNLNPLRAPPHPRAWGPQLLLGLSLVLTVAATAWLASAHLLVGWQFR